MTELFVLLLVVIVSLAVIWFVQSGRGSAAKQRGIHDSRLTGHDDDGTHRAPPVVSDVRPRVVPTAEVPRREGKGAGLFEDAAATATGVPYERAADEIEQITADLARARREAERSAEQMVSRAAETRAAIQTVAATHGGAIPGDGTDRCPAKYPIKATMATMRYLTSDQLAYNRLVPDICLESIAAAEAAGFSGPESDPATVPRSTVIEEASDEDDHAGTERERQ